MSVVPAHGRGALVHGFMNAGALAVVLVIALVATFLTWRT